MCKTAIGQNPVNCFKDEGKYTVSLTAISDLGCTHTIQKNDLITVYQIPKAMFSAEPKETTLSNPIITVSNQSVGAEKFLWRFGDNENSTLFIEVIHILKKATIVSGFWRRMILAVLIQLKIV